MCTTGIYIFPGLGGQPLPPPPALDDKVLDSWKTMQHSNKATRFQTTLAVTGQFNV